MLAERFELGSVVAEGGMGVVRRARDLRTGAPVAIKLLHGASGAAGAATSEPRPELRARFVREAEAIARLAHPAIVAHVAHGESALGEAGEAPVPWLAMAWIEGENLGTRLARGPLGVAAAVALARRIADALDHAHAAGITHRDLKPDNVVLEGGELERAVLVDFGIARVADADRRTRTGTTMGTPGYMAPEQAVGARDVDERADVFSLGAVLFECVAGRPAFEGSHPMALLAKLLIDDAPPLRTVVPGVPSALDDLVGRMLAKDRDRRPQAMREVVRALDAIAAATPAEGVPLEAAPRLSFAEQRLLTIVASTAPADDGDTVETDAMTLHETLERAAAANVIEAEAARVARLGSGAIVALFTGDETPADQAMRATRAAIAHARATPGVRIVVATGRVVVATHLPAGAVIEDAVRALFASRGAGVRLDSATAALVGERWTMRVVEGALFEIVAERVREAPLRGVLGQATPFVGRERELALLSASFESCREAREAQAVVVIGAPGMGKSRLRREAIARIAARDPSARVMLARGEILGAGGAYGMLAAMLRREAGVLADEPPAAQRARLEARLEGLGLSRETVGFLCEFAHIPVDDGDLPALRAARADPRLLGDRMREAWLAWLRAECDRGACVLVLEDLQWGDRPTVQLALSTLSELRELPLLVLAFARPDVRQQFPALWSEAAPAEIVLAPIAQRAAQSLVRSVLGDEVPEDTLAKMLDRAAGSPLFLEEVTRAVAAGRDDLPDTVLAIAQARLDDLEPSVRRVLRAASVLGQRAYEGAIAAILGETDEGGRRATREALEALVRREVLVHRSDRSLAGDSEHGFRHDVLREAAYATLPPEERALAHRIAGAWLEERGIESAVVRAEHHERGGEGARAAVAWLEAARESLAGDDLDAALARALRGQAAIAASVEARATAIELHLVAALAHRWAFRPAEAEREAAAALAEATPGSSAYFRAIGERILASARIGEREALVRWIRAAHEVAAHDEDAALAQVEALLTGGGQAALLGEAQRATDLVAEAEAALGRSLESEPRVAPRMHLVLAMTAAARGDLGSAARHHRATVVRFEAIGDARSAVGARINAGLEELELGLYEAGLEQLERALADAERMKLAYILAFARSNLGLALERLDRLSDAEHQLRKVIETSGDVRSRLVGSAFIYLSRVHVKAGDLARAIESAEAGVERTTAFPPMHALALGALSSALLAAGRAEEALARSTEGRAVLARIGSMEEGESLLALAHVEALIACGRRAEGVAIARAERERLVALAGTLGDAAMARAVLTRVSENARLIAIAAESA